jgi:Rho GDP-dissociation inhibitor
LKYLQVVKRAGVKVDKVPTANGHLTGADHLPQLEQMLGSYGAGPAVTKKFLDEEAPSGMIARSGTYAVRSRLVDDGACLALPAPSP